MPPSNTRYNQALERHLVPGSIADAQSSQRNLPARGFKPAYYLAAMLGIVIYGFYQHGKAARELK